MKMEIWRRGRRGERQQYDSCQATIGQHCLIYYPNRGGGGEREGKHNHDSKEVTVVYRHDLLGRW